MRDARLLMKLTVAGVWLIGACEAEVQREAQPDASVEVKPEAAPTPEPAMEEPAAKPEPVVEAEAPAQPSVDVLTVPQLDAEIVEVHRRGWSACGVIHVVGLIEVEVLDAGEPRPRIGLVISCPGDMGRSVRLEVGERIHVELHDKRPFRWPRPTVDPPEGLPLRYVASLENIGGPDLDRE